MSSECFASWATSPSCNPSSSGKQSTLVKKVIEFLHANLCEACVDSAYGYGFLDGTEERKEDFIEQFTTLNSKCLVRSTTHVKERSRKSSENGIFNLLYFFFFAFCVCNFWENENDCAKQRTNQGRPCQGFHVYITKQLDLLLPVFFWSKTGIS